MQPRSGLRAQRWQCAARNPRRHRRTSSPTTSPPLPPPLPAICDSASSSRRCAPGAVVAAAMHPPTYKWCQLRAAAGARTRAATSSTSPPRSGSRRNAAPICLDRAPSARASSVPAPPAAAQPERIRARMRRSQVRRRQEAPSSTSGGALAPLTAAPRASGLPRRTATGSTRC